jgi:RNA polymerase sigma factor (sigma-70 family)
LQIIFICKFFFISCRVIWFLFVYIIDEERRGDIGVDDLIIRSAQRGNKEDFRKIVEGYSGVVFSVCFSVLKDYQEAENATQETFIQVYSSLHAYQFKGFKTWVSRIALNKSIDLRRKLQKSCNFNAVTLDDNMDCSINNVSLIEDELIRGEEARKIKDLCNKLPEVYGKIINKYYIQAKSYEQIAKEEGISIKTVESRLYRGRKKLKENWGEGG